MSTRNNITDRTGKTVGYTVSENGRERTTDVSGHTVATHHTKDDRTTDHTGKTVAKGNVSSSFLGRRF